MKKQARSAAEIIAFHLGWDINEVKEYRYQSTMRPGMAIYAFDEDYMCCPAANKKPMYTEEFPWKPLAEWHGRTIYNCTVDEVTAHQGL